MASDSTAGEQPRGMAEMVTGLVPSLSRSLAEQFNVFRVMHHGTHEKQLSNVFAWLLTDGATHELGDAFQRIFLARVNARRSADGQLPPAGYRVIQEVDTRGDGEAAGGVGRDIADIVLSGPEASVVIENFATSDGHGHDFQRYLAHGGSTADETAVVLLCHRREAHRQRDGWEQAIVVTYGDVLEDLHDQVVSDRTWSRRHPDQLFFIRQMIQHFVEGAAAVNSEDQIAFIRTMCETGESSRYGHRPQGRAAQEFADLVAEHARRQFDDGRRALARVKRGLRSFARAVLVDDLNQALDTGPVERFEARWVGKWEWSVRLLRTEGEPSVRFSFGPTAVVTNEQVPDPISDPDFTRVFAVKESTEEEPFERILQSDVGLIEVIEGLAPDDSRLRDAALAALDREGTGAV